MYCVLLKVCASFHGLSYGGAKARTAALHFEIFESVVRRLRTTHRKLSPLDSRVCVFAPLEQREIAICCAVTRRLALSYIVNKYIHDQSSCMTW